MIPQIDFQELKNRTFQRTIINNFDADYLYSIANQLNDKIVLFDLSKNKESKSLNVLSQFMQDKGKNWRGIELNFTFQNSVITLPSFENLNNGLKTLRNLESLCITFGGVFVSRSWAENHSKDYRQWQQVNIGWKFQFENYYPIIESFTKIVEQSPNLKRIWVDFQGLNHECQLLLPQLTKLNESLQKCSQLEDYIFSMNHSRMKSDETLSLFFDSFVCLKDKKKLRKFIMNITDWNLSYQNIKQISTIFSDFLTFDKQEFVEFEFDHSQSQVMDQFQDLTEIQLLANSFKQFLYHHKNTLTKFYLSLCQYQCNYKHVIQIQQILKPLSECSNLERISIRLSEWNCRDLKTEMEFYQQVKNLLDLQKLKFLYFAPFQFNQNDKLSSELLKKLFNLIRIKSKLEENLRLTIKSVTKSNIPNTYRKDIIQQMLQIFTKQDSTQNSNEQKKQNLEKLQKV